MPINLSASPTAEWWRSASKWVKVETKLDRLGARRDRDVGARDRLRDRDSPFDSARGRGPLGNASPLPLMSWIASWSDRSLASAVLVHCAVSPILESIFAPLFLLRYP